MAFAIAISILKVASSAHLAIFFLTLEDNSSQLSSTPPQFKISFLAPKDT